MADKPEFVDMISEATRQSYRRAMPRIVDLPTVAQGNLASQPLAAGALGAVADGDADAVEDQAVGSQGLVIDTSVRHVDENRRPIGRLFHFSPSHQ